MNQSKYSRILSTLVIFMLLMGCTAPTSPIPTQEVSTRMPTQTITPSPIPTHTPMPSPTATATPTLTPTPTEVPVTASAIAAGTFHTCAVTDRGGVKCWGQNGFGQLGDGTFTTRLTPVDVVGLTSGVKDISIGEHHTCALTTNGGVKCWGWNWSGQLGDGTTEQRPTPVDVVGLTSGVVSVAVNESHTCALTIAGGVKCWGDNGYGELGDGTKLDRLTPVNVVRLTNGVKAITAGRFYTCVVMTGGRVKCWGGNWSGQLGDGTTEQRLTPVDVVGMTSGVVSVVAGESHTCALTNGGGVRCWGDNWWGQLGDGTTEQRLTPVQVVGLTISATKIAAGPSHTCALTTSGEAKCWGSNQEGQLGDGSTEDRMTPVKVAGLRIRLTAIASGGSHTCGLTTIGGVKCWGSDEYGQLGDGSGEEWLTVGEVVGLTGNITAIDAGDSHTCVLTTGWGVKCWGSGRDGDNTSMVTPVDLEGFTSGVTSVSTSGESTCHSFCNCNGMTCVFSTNSGVTCWTCNIGYPSHIEGLASDLTVISVGIGHACGLTTSGSIKCWGSNSLGQLGNPTITYSFLSPVDVVGLTDVVKAVSAGYVHTCALTTSGGVKCWGWNRSGQLGDGTKADRSTPVDVVGLTSGVQAISAGMDHTCALMTSGGVKCWGINWLGQLGDGTTNQRLTPVDVIGLMDGVTAISAGWYHTCALTTSGGIQCWGSNDHGQLGDGTTEQRLNPVEVVGLPSGVTTIAVGVDHTCALTAGGGVVCWGSNLHGTLGRGTSAIQTTPVDVVGFGP